MASPFGIRNYRQKFVFQTRIDKNVSQARKQITLIKGFPDFPKLPLTPLRQERANLPAEPFFLIFRRFLKIEEKNEDPLNS